MLFCCVLEKTLHAHDTETPLSLEFLAAVEN